MYGTCICFWLLRYDTVAKSIGTGVHALKLSFAGSKGTILVKNLNKTLENVLSSNIKNLNTYTGQKSSSRF